jgi:hypothetical protein
MRVLTRMLVVTLFFGSSAYAIVPNPSIPALRTENLQTYPYPRALSGELYRLSEKQRNDGIAKCRQEMPPEYLCVARIVCPLVSAEGQVQQVIAAEFPGEGIRVQLESPTGAKLTLEDIKRSGALDRAFIDFQFHTPTGGLSPAEQTLMQDELQPQIQGLLTILTPGLVVLFNENIELLLECIRKPR